MARRESCIARIDHSGAENMQIAEFLDRLQGVKRTGKNCQARCPAHDDRQASMSVSEGDDGRILVKCFAGCETQAIVEALGLEMKDLFLRREGGRGINTSPKTPATVQHPQAVP